MEATGIILLVLIVVLVAVALVCFYRVITDAIFGGKHFELRRDDLEQPSKKR